MAHPTFNFETEVLVCDPATIAFPESQDATPSISSPETLARIEKASECIRADQLVAIPTETVYGLAASALSADAVRKIFLAKGRPSDNPLIVHIASLAMLRALLPPEEEWTTPPSYKRLIKRFWPGPLTLLFPASARIPSIVSAGHPTVAIRMPSHPVARALIAISGTPLAAPSANLSGRPSPTRAEHVLHDMRARLPVILDGGPCDVGLESTVVDGISDPGVLKVLRPGGVTVEAMEEALAGLGADDEAERSPLDVKVLVHRRDYSDEAMEHAPTTPGMKYRHYSPKSPVILVVTPLSLFPASMPNPVSVCKAIQDIVSAHSESGTTPRIGVLHLSDSPLCLRIALAHPSIELHPFLLGSSDNPVGTAQRLFDGLLTLDALHLDAILVEAVREDREGLAIMNRMRKAASEVVYVGFEDGT